MGQAGPRENKAARNWGSTTTQAKPLKKWDARKNSGKIVTGGTRFVWSLKQVSIVRKGGPRGSRPGRIYHLVAEVAKDWS